MKIQISEIYHKKDQQLLFLMDIKSYSKRQFLPYTKLIAAATDSSYMHENEQITYIQPSF